MSVEQQVKDLWNEFDQEDVRREKVEKWIADLPEDQLMAAMKALNPHGPVIAGRKNDEAQVSLSYTNMRMEYAKRYAMVGLIAFASRMVKEWQVPDEVQPVDPEDYLRDPTILDTPAHIKDPQLQAKWAENRESMRDRLVVSRFFKDIFDFDPDRHVAAALQTNLKDPQRKAPATAAVRRAVTSRKNAIRSSVKRQDYEAKESDLTPVETTLTNEVERACFETIPSADTFARLDRYLEEHHEEVIETTAAVYGVQPDVDFLVNVYDKHETKADASRFKDKHMEQVIAPITLIQPNRWAILGPYRENRERVDFLNRHTEVLKEMIDQRERDSHVATDIMKKRIKTKKAANIAESGPDDREFRRFVRDNKPQIANLGGEHISQEEPEDDCPENAVEVNVFTLKDGGREMKVHKIYNPVEAPAGGSGENPTSGSRHDELVAQAKNITVSSL